jgi:hypothetical protein
MKLLDMERKIVDCMQHRGDVDQEHVHVPHGKGESLLDEAQRGGES